MEEEVMKSTVWTKTYENRRSFVGRFRYSDHNG
jgi:hypothetical protein